MKRHRLFAGQVIGIMASMISSIHSFRITSSLRRSLASSSTYAPRSTTSPFRSTTSNLSTSSSLEARKSRGRNRQSDGGSSQTSTVTGSDGGLSWETFDFSESPKWDKRFRNGDEDNDSRQTDGMIHVPSNGEDWDVVSERETAEDIALHDEFERRHKLWQELDPELVQAATDILLPYVQDDRVKRIENVLQKRTQQTRFLFENPANPSNVWACLRTLDSFGIQHVDVIVQSGKYKGKAALSQKRGMRTAMGSAKWLSVKNHLNTESALRTITTEGYHIMCTDVNPSSKDIREVDWDASGKPICIVMGNEQSGISATVREVADESFYLPMVGFAESFNLSVATAITLAHLSASSNREGGKGPLRAGDLSEREYKTLLLKGFINSINHKTASALFRKNGLQFPKDLNLS